MFNAKQGNWVTLLLLRERGLKLIEAFKRITGLCPFGLF